MRLLFLERDILHRKGTVSGFTPLLDKDGKPVVSQ